MSLLDDAIRQHLDLKRKHGASEDEVRELEDQAFGAAERPGDEGGSPAADVFDEAAEAPTQFLGEAAAGTAAPPDAGAELEETSFLETEPAPETAEAEAGEPVGEIAPEPPAPPEPPVSEPPAPPISDEAGEDPFEVPPYRLEDEEQSEEPSAMEHEISPPPDETSEEPSGTSDDEPPEVSAADLPQAVAEEPPEAASTPGAPGALSPEEREEIASQPTELYDFESDAGEDSPADTAAPLPGEPPEPPPAPPAEPPPSDVSALEESNFEEETGEETFFDEQSLSDELDQALDAPGDAGIAPAAEPEADEGEAPAPPPPPRVGEGEGDDEDEDLLEETPDFLQDTPEGERLWFEQKPPKDFDFDD